MAREADFALDQQQLGRKPPQRNSDQRSLKSHARQSHVWVKPGFPVHRLDPVPQQKAYEEAVEILDLVLPAKGVRECALPACFHPAQVYRKGVQRLVPQRPANSPCDEPISLLDLRDDAKRQMKEVQADRQPQLLRKTLKRRIDLWNWPDTQEIAIELQHSAGSDSYYVPIATLNRIPFR